MRPLLAAFRGSPPGSTLRADSSGPSILIGWYLLPAVAVLACGTVGLILTRGGVAGLAWAGLLAAALVGWGLGRVQRLTDEHRI